MSLHDVGIFGCGMIFGITVMAGIWWRKVKP